jgi:hypothetical protein
MNLHMASRAVLVTDIRHGMGGRREGHAITLAAKVSGAVVAFQAKRENLRPPQEARVDAAMRRVAGMATVHAHPGVFKNERPALVDVALQAWFFILQTVRHHAGPRHHAGVQGIGAMGVMAIRTLHKAFVDTVLDRQGELGPDLSVAVAAKFRLRPGEEFGLRLCFGRGLMNGVAIRANHVGKGVGTAADVGAAQLILMAAQAIIEGRFGGKQGKRNDFRFVALGGGMLSSGPMAAFAAPVFKFHFFVG